MKMGNRELHQAIILLSYLVLVLCCCAGGEVRTQTTLDLERGRILVDGENMPESTSALSGRTERVDPLNSFKKYKGGYNITNKHYLSSVIYTGRYGYITGAVWLFGGLVYAIISLISSRTCLLKDKKQKKRLPCSVGFCLFPILVGLFLTFLAIVASGIALVGSSKFDSRAQSIKSIIAETAEEASGTIYKVTGAVVAMQDITELYGGTLEGSSQLNYTLEKLQNEAAHIQQNAEQSMRLLNKGIKILKLMTMLTIVANLFVVLSLLALRPFRLYQIFQLCIIICWLFTFLFWMYFGLYFFLDKFSGDTCAALDEYRLNPENSTLSSILPCNKQLSANMILHDVQEGIHNIIDQVNYNISIAKSSYLLPDLEYVCNPFSGPPGYGYEPENCSSNTIKIGDVPQILKRYTCSDRYTGACTQGKFIPASIYTKIQVYTSSIQAMLDAFPSTERLADCQLVKDAFSELLLRDCKPLTKFAHTTWAALTGLSTVMVALLLILTLETYHDSKYHNAAEDLTSTEGLQYHTTKVASEPNDIRLEP